MDQPQGHGLILEDPAPEDFVFGAERSLGAKFAGREVRREDGNWVFFLPKEEEQSTPDTETNACATFGTLNIIETLRKQQYQFDENYSDRFVAKGSETNPAVGNTPKRVGEFLRKCWAVIEDEWPFSKDMTVEEFYAPIDPALPPRALKNKVGYEFGYEYVGNTVEEMREALKYSPLGMSVPAWFLDEDGRYVRPDGWRDNHWVECYNVKENGDMEVFDTYPPFFKVVRSDCRPSVVMGYHLNKVSVATPAQTSFWQSVVQFIKSIFN